MVPPLTWIPATVFSSNLINRVGSSISPFSASKLPQISQSFSWAARFTIPLITAFKPGQSPPPVATSIFFMIFIFGFLKSN
jgi:hypothetical protein